jgi:hypothetical protein
MLGVVFGLMGLTAVFLARMQGNQRLGQPGLRIVAETLYTERGRVAATNAIQLPRQVLEYQSKPLEVTELELGWLPPDTTYGRRRYIASDNDWLDIQVVLMGQDRTSIHKPQYCLEGQGFAIERTESLSIPIAKPHAYQLPVTKLSIAKEGKGANGQKVRYNGFYVYWFLTDKLLTADHRQRIWWMARDLVRTGTLQRWAYVSAFVVCLPGQEEAASQRLTRFLQAAVPEIQLVAGPPVGSIAQAQIPQPRP